MFIVYNKYVIFVVWSHWYSQKPFVIDSKNIDETSQIEDPTYYLRYLSDNKLGNWFTFLCIMIMNKIY